MAETINPEKQISVDVGHVMVDSQVYIDTQKTAVWTWGRRTEILKKYTQEGVKEIGYVGRGVAASLVHVDEKDRVYLMDQQGVLVYAGAYS